MAKTLKIGSVGLGRLGYEHAKNIANYVTGAELTAICDTDAARVAQVAEELNVPYTYTDVAEMVKNPELDAIVVVSPSMFHAEHIKLALDAGKHCFCDKPLDTTVEKCKLAEKAVEAHPDKVFMLGFMRRFDDSYAEAKRRIDAGDIGKVVLVRSYTQDPRTTIEGTLKFAPHSGGQYLDMCVHDLDLIRWFTGAEVKRVWAIGGVFEFDLYRELNDADNCCATVQLDNGAMGFMFTNRTPRRRLQRRNRDHWHARHAAYCKCRRKEPAPDRRRLRRTRGVLSGLPQPLASGLYQRDPGVRILHQRGPQARCHRLRRHQGFSGGIPLQGIL